jgi:lysophospholipase L1-like esterase
MMAELAATQKIKVIFASVLPVSDYHKDVNPAYEVTPGRPPLYIKALNDWLQGLCSQRGYTYLNYFPALVDGAGQFQADLADDGLHPNAKGYGIMAPLALEAIAKTVGSPQQNSSPAKSGKRRETSSR